MRKRLAIMSDKQMKIVERAKKADTVKIIEDSGYKTLLEDYEIIEQKSDTVFVVKEKK